MIKEKNLIPKLREELHLIPSFVREIIQSFETQKITRSFLNDRDLYACSKVFDEIGLKIFISSVKFSMESDLGKGGYSNAILTTTSENSAEGFYRVHIGANENDLAIAKQMDEEGDDVGLGKMLGHNTCTICAIIANRIVQKYSKDYKKTVETMIQIVLERLTS